MGLGGFGVGVGFGGFGVGVGFAGLGVGLGLVSAQLTEAVPRLSPIPTSKVAQIFVIGFKTANRFFIGRWSAQQDKSNRGDNPRPPPAGI